MVRLTLCAPRLLAAAAATLATFAVAHAQGPGAPPQMSPQQMAARQEEAKKAFAKEMGLTPQQMTKLEALQKKYNAMAQTRIAALRKKYGEKPTQAQQQAAMKEMQAFATETKAASDKELKIILTPAQFQKIQNMQAKAMQRRGG